MVQQLENDNGLNKPQGAEAEAEEQIDTKLVNELRDLIKKELNDSCDAGEAKYCLAHYNAIQNPQSMLTCWRYLTHCNLDLDKAFELMKTSLAWRYENKIDQLRATDFVKEFWLYGPLHFTGKSKNFSDLIYIIGKDYRKADPNFRDHVTNYISYLLFNWDKLEELTLSKLCIVFDITDAGYRNVDLEFMGWLIKVCDYIPSRIDRVYAVGIPFLLRPIARLIISWLPAHFSSITECGSFPDLVERNIEPDQYPNDVGGLRDDSYRFAPAEVPWVEQSEEFNQAKVIKAIENCFMTQISVEKREKLRQLQLEHEAAKQPLLKNHS